MSKTEDFKLSLLSLLELLKEERQALIRNNSDLIIEIIEKKMTIVSDLEGLDMGKVKNNEELRDISMEIKEIQETNTLLTKQALSFQEDLIKSIASGTKEDASIYSQKGKYEAKNQSVNFVDKEI